MQSLLFVKKLLKMRKCTEHLSYKLEPGLLIGLAIAILVVPISWLTAWIIAVAIHELGHYCVLRICTKGIYGAQFGGGGIKLYTEELGRVEGLCALAGPVASFIVSMTCIPFPRLRICAFVQAIYNVLPIYPLDGGRILKWFITHILKIRNFELIFKWVTIILIVILSYTTIILIHRYSLGVLPIILPIHLFVKYWSTKYSCKECRLRVQ